MKNSFHRIRLTSIALGFVLIATLGASLDSCAFLDLLTGMYTGTYAEYSACPLTYNNEGCEIYDVIEDTEQWEDCLMCELDAVLGDASGKASHRQDAEKGLFWVENNDRMLHWISGTTSDEVLDLAYYPMGIGLDDERVYWTDWRTGGIVQANHDGSDIRALLGAKNGLSGISVDPALQVLFFGDPHDGTIGRLDLSGGTAADIVTGQDGPTDLALDGSGRLYWIDNSLTGGSIRRANLDGSDVETVASDLTSPFSLAIDPVGGRMYWSDMLNNAIRRANLDGSSQEDVLSGLEAPGGLAIDPGGGKIYWVDMNTVHVKRANLDGTDVETVMFGQPVADLAVDTADGQLYGTGWIGRSVFRANLDGSEIDPIVTPGRIDGDPVFDGPAKKLYWSSRTSGSVFRANIDATGIEEITSGAVGLGDVAFDSVSHQVFWVTSGSIVRSAPDGSNATTIQSGITFIGDIEVDPTDAKIYWVNQQVIGRSNLDGTESETYYNDPSYPEQLAIQSGNLYWSVPIEGVVRRASTDGSGEVEDVVTGAGFLYDLDASAEYLYWSVPSQRLIQRSRLDGTDLETVLTAGTSISGLAVVPVRLDAGPTDVETRTQPDDFALAQNYPNPSRGITTIEFALPIEADVRIEIFELLGRKVATLENGRKPAGRHAAALDASLLGSGMYVYRMRAGDVALARMMTLVE